MRYFDSRTQRPIIIGQAVPSGTFLTGTSASERAISVRFRPYSGGIPGLPLGHPEARLVDRYVDWIGAPAQFDHARPAGTGGVTDLFNRTTWTLFEAKSSADDRAIREAFGQLYDYRRGFPRSPSLAILVPEQPRPRLIRFLEHFRVTAVWERSQRGFDDSWDGRLTTDLRARYRALSRR